MSQPILTIGRQGDRRRQQPKGQTMNTVEMLKVQTIVGEMQDEIDRLQARIKCLEDLIARGDKIFGNGNSTPLLAERE